MTGPDESRLARSWSLRRSLRPDEFVDLYARGVRLLRITAAVDLTAMSGADAARFVLLLREAAAAGLRVQWRGAIGAFPVAWVRHLSPPLDEATGAYAWRRPGPSALLIRVGPGFLVVEDQRCDRLIRTVIGSEDRCYPLLRTPTPVCPPEQVDPEVSAQLVARRLALTIDGWLVTLPLHRSRGASVPTAPVTGSPRLLPVLPR